MTLYSLRNFNWDRIPKIIWISSDWLQCLHPIRDLLQTSVAVLDHIIIDLPGMLWKCQVIQSYCVWLNLPIRIGVLGHATHVCKSRHHAGAMPSQTKEFGERNTEQNGYICPGKLNDKILFIEIGIETVLYTYINVHHQIGEWNTIKAWN